MRALRQEGHSTFEHREHRSQCGGGTGSKEELMEGVEGDKDKLTWGPELS